MRQISKELYENLKSEGRLEKLEVGKKEYERTGNFLFIESADDADEDKLKEYNKENKTELCFYLIRAVDIDTAGIFLTREKEKVKEAGEVIDSETITEGAEEMEEIKADGETELQPEPVEIEEEKPKAKSHKGKNKKEDEGHGA